MHIALDHERTFDHMATAYDDVRLADGAILNCLIKLTPITASRLLDIGCGTGRYSIDLALVLNLELTGVDRSAQMIAKASSKLPTATWVQGHAEDVLPQMSSASIDLAVISYSMHLFDWKVVLKEARRLIARPGRIFIISPAPETVHTSIYHQFFPELIEIDRARHPAYGEVAHTLTKLGFSVERRDFVCCEQIKTRADILRLVSRGSQRFCSTLYYISDGRLHNGLQAMFSHIAAQIAKTSSVQLQTQRTVIVATGD